MRNSMNVEEYRAALSATSTRSERRDEEHEHQRRFFVFVDLLGLWHPEHADSLKDVWAVPNGGHRFRRTAAKMKAEGVRRGVLDIECWVPRQGYHALVIEMKSSDGRLSTEQRDRIARLQERRYRCAVCRSWEDAARMLCAYFGIAFREGWVFAVEHAASSPPSTKPPRQRRRQKLA